MNQLSRNISSLEVAEMVEREHKNVIRDIEKIKLDLGQLKIEHTPYFVETTYTHPQNKQQYPMFLLTKQGCELYGNRMTGVDGTAFSVKYINRFNEMEEKQKVKFTLPDDPVELALQTSLKNYQEIKGIKEDVNYLKDSMRIDGIQQKAIQSAAKGKAIDALGGFDTKAYKALSSKTFRSIWKEFNTYFQLPRYGELPKAKFDEALYFISKWRPSAALVIEIEACNRQETFRLVD